MLLSIYILQLFKPDDINFSRRGFVAIEGSIGQAPQIFKCSSLEFESKDSSKTGSLSHRPNENDFSGLELRNLSRSSCCKERPKFMDNSVNLKKKQQNS